MRDRQQRVLPAPDTFATCPYEGRILDYYAGTFDAVYVLLSPFLRPVSIDRMRLSSDDYPSKAELHAGCEPIPWHRVLTLGGFSSLGEIDVGLRTSIGGLRRHLERKDLSGRLADLQAKHDIEAPPEGDVSPLLENRIFEALQNQGYTWLWIGDEFCTERKLHWIDDLKESDVRTPHANLFTPDKRLLVTTHWDSHFSFLCGTHSTIESIVTQASFEGFFCKPETEVYWSLH